VDTTADGLVYVPLLDDDYQILSTIDSAKGQDDDPGADVAASAVGPAQLDPLNP
jgi:hypothetical protein